MEVSNLQAVKRTPRANRNYTHFAVLKSNNLIITGWEYKKYDHSEMMEFKKDYFYNDLTDMQADYKLCKIVKASTLINQGVDPYDFANWNKDMAVFTL